MNWKRPWVWIRIAEAIAKAAGAIKRAFTGEKKDEERKE